ncbi:hypothetical protein [Nitratireductor thuwali]|uniref:Uncharacterized protein n=1 Tax=Nitratireductor thuwali TaxID=2267699 RepID=A0ABY5MDY5_9HYPH|nr:hypothetical protein NTH_00100 [Nitratireductor thuwali]
MAGKDWIFGSAQILALAALCAVSAELLAAYSDSTGDIGAVLFNLIFFMALYGAPALLMRELARRLGWGWPSLLLLCAALGVLQACIIDQSMFAEQYHGYAGWEESRSATLIPEFGISAHNAYNFIIGHIIFSYAGPIAIAEAWRPKPAEAPWLRPFGMIVAAVFYVGSAALIMLDPESQSASQTQLVTSWLLVAACFLAAVLIGRRNVSIRSTPTGRVSPLVVLAVTFAVAVLSNFAGEGWFGVVVGLGSTILILAMIIQLRMRFVWTPRHSAAVALGYLLSRGVLAFTYFPLLGEVEPLPKYLHNVAMLAIVLAAGILALKVGGPRDDAKAVGE